ncbi:MAG: M1 family metallopeptidase [Pseudomonadota bacterium]
MAPIIPIHYQLELTPNLATFRFAGTVEILLQARGDVEEIVLNAKELAFWRCRVREKGSFSDCPISVDPKLETVRIGLPQKMKGELRLLIDYEGVINDRMGGWYRSGYVSDGQAKFMAVTQCQESFARQVLPCFDSPEKKATFDVTLVVDQPLTVVSNEEIVDELREGNGKKRVRFRRTPKMSSYLLFLGVGEFDRITHETDRRVQAITPPGRTPEARYGLEFGQKALAFCEDYFQIPYPLGKMDLIAVPDFAFGAMENWGAITFRENLLLYDSEKTSQAGVARICEVIAHEIVHQWFGNLASPSDWKYLWLNESFATYTSYDVVDHYYPEWGTWEQFIYNQSASALERDGLFETFPIELPGGGTVAINTATAPIIYNKGGSILRQMRGYLGDDRYREGLVKYLTAHAYDCAASPDLWEAFEAVAQKPVTALMKSWIEQPGFPLIEVHREGRELVLRQQRFTYLAPPANGAASEKTDTSGRWLVPVSLQLIGADGASRHENLLMDAEELRLDMGEEMGADMGSGTAAYKVNAGQTGFYRVRYAQKEAVGRLGALARDKALSSFDRWGLQDDLFAMVRRGTERIGAYLEFLKFYENEDAFLPLMSIADHLHLSSLVLAQGPAAAVNAFGREFFDRILSRIGFDPVADEPHTTAIVRDHLLFLAALFGSSGVAAFAGKKFTALMAGESIHPDIMKSVLQVGAMTEAETAFDWMVRRMETADSEHERMNLLSALGCFREEKLIRRGLSYAMDRVPARNKHIPIAAFAVNPGAMAFMWPWYEENHKKFDGFHPLIFERVISSLIPVAGMEREAEVSAFFKDDPGRTSAAAGVIKMSLEKLAINLNMRKAHS